MDKTLPKHRFIISGTNTILNGLSEEVTKCLKVLVNTARYLNNYKIRGLTRHISIIDNRTDVLSFLSKSNKANDRNKSIKSFDFENLCTNIPHNKLKEQIKSFVFRIFELKTRNYITISKWIEYIIDNSIIIYIGEMFRQVIGIPMGTSCAPYLANIFLHI